MPKEKPDVEFFSMLDRKIFHLKASHVPFLEFRADKNVFRDSFLI